MICSRCCLESHFWEIGYDGEKVRLSAPPAARDSASSLGTCICRSRGAGSQINGAPIQVKIWFTEKLEPALSKIQVFDISGLEVDKRDVKIDQSNPALLTVSLPELKPGKYKVVWRAVSVDTHVTTGNFTFELL